VNDIVYVVLVVAATALLQSITGFGFALLSVPLFALRIDVHEAVVLSTCLGTISSGWQSYLLKADAQRSTARRYVVASLVGIPIGYAAFVLLDDQALRVIVGTAVLLGTAVVAFGGAIRVGRNWENLLGIVSGVLLIATSTNGPPIVLALQAQRMPMLQFRATLARIFFVTGVISVALFALADEMNLTILSSTVACLPVMTLSVLLGNRLVGRLAEARFRILVLSLLVAAGLSTLVGAIA
jgi:uncharacterized membrane protein YfcA